jgi:hypothetical protein
VAQKTTYIIKGKAIEELEKGLEINRKNMLKVDDICVNPHLTLQDRITMALHGYSVMKRDEDIILLQ